MITSQSRTSNERTQTHTHWCTNTHTLRHYKSHHQRGEEDVSGWRCRQTRHIMGQHQPHRYCEAEHTHSVSTLCYYICKQHCSFYTYYKYTAGTIKASVDASSRACKQQIQRDLSRSFLLLLRTNQHCVLKKAKTWFKPFSETHTHTHTHTHPKLTFDT